MWGPSILFRQFFFLDFLSRSFRFLFCFVVFVLFFVVVAVVLVSTWTPKIGFTGKVANRSEVFLFCFVFWGFIYLFIYSWEPQRGGRDIHRERSRLHVGISMWDLILGPQGHTLGLRQTFNRWAIQASQKRGLK